MRQRRTIYFNDARHYYLFCFEPPMTMEDAWTPVDEVAGTAVDTFIYGVARDDGLFYPSKVGLVFGNDMPTFRSSYYYRTHNSIKGLEERGLDLLTVLIDRAHEKGMDFIASLRLGAYGGLDPTKVTRNGGRGWVHEEMRDHLFAILKELATEYPTEGVELDFAAPPGGSPYCLLEEDVPEYTPVITEWVKNVAEMARGRPNGPGLVGARVYPTKEMNAAAGVDVLTWLKEGLVDYVTPLVYAHNLLDADMPIDWLVEAAHDAGISVYAFLMPYYTNEQRQYHTREWATPEMMRAAASNYWDRDCDGMYTWFMRWPLGDTERRTLTELGDPDLVKEGTKHYVVNRSTEYARKVRTGFDRSLPLEIPKADPETCYQIPFYISDDPEGARDRVRQVLLKIKFDQLISADKLTVSLNGRSLSGETCLRYRGGYLDQSNIWMEFHLEEVRPRKGRNVLKLSLVSRPDRLSGGITVEDVEIIIEHGPYPSGLVQ